MYRNPEIEEVVSLLKQEMLTLNPAQRGALERGLIVPRKLGIDDSPGEFVVAVAAFGDKLLYWSDVEEGWELDVPSQDNTISSRGCSQFELQHVLRQTLGSTDAA